MFVPLLLVCFLFGFTHAQTITYYTVIKNTRSEDKSYVIGGIQFNGDLEACKSQCENTPECVVFNYNVEGKYCYLNSADKETKYQEGYDRYIKYVVDATSPINGLWSAWSDPILVSGTTCSDMISERTRLCNNPPPSNSGLDCVGESKETIVSDCLKNVYSLTESTRAENKDNLIELYFGNAEDCQARCDLLDTCLNFDYNIDSEYCYLHSVTAETKKQDGYSKYIKFTVDTSKDVNGGWGAWGKWEDGPGEHCSNRVRKRTRLCDSPPRFNDGLDCIGDDTDLVQSKCFYGLPDLTSYSDVFVEHSGIKSNSLGTYVQMHLKDIDIDTCKQYALVRQSDINRAVDYDRKNRLCYIQGKEFFVAGNTTSDPDFTHFELRNLPSPNLIPMPGPYVDIRKSYAKHTSSSPQILNVTVDINNCKAQCLEISDCLFFGYLPSTKFCIIYNGNITETLQTDPDELENIYLVDRIWSGFPKSIPAWSARDTKISSVSIVDKTLEECKLLCLYNHKCNSISYNHNNPADSCNLYSTLLDETFELFALYNEEEGYEINFSYHKINDLMAFDFDKIYVSNEGGRSVPYFTNIITEITGYLIDCQRTCMGLSDCLAFDFTTYTDLSDHGRCYLQNTTTETPLLSTTDTTFYYYELNEHSQKVDLKTEDKALQCPVGATCTGVYEKFESSRSQFMWENIIFELEGKGTSVEDCKQACTDNADCVAIDYNFGDKDCYLKGYSHAVVAHSNYIHFKLTARELQSDVGNEGGLSNTMLIIIISCSIGGFVIFIIGCLLALKIYKKKQQDLLDGMTPEEYVLQNGGNTGIDLCSDEDYQKSKDLNKGETSLDTLMVMNDKKEKTQEFIDQESTYLAMEADESPKGKIDNTSDYLVIDTPSGYDDDSSNIKQAGSNYMAVTASQNKNSDKEKAEDDINEYVDMNVVPTTDSSSHYVDLPVEL